MHYFYGVREHRTPTGTSDVVVGGAHFFGSYSIGLHKIIS